MRLLPKKRGPVLAALLFAVAGVSFVAFSLYESRQQQRIQNAVALAARREGAEAAQRDIRNGRLILKRVCRYPWETEAWARHGVECPAWLGGPPLPETARLREAEYESVMDQHVRHLLGPAVLQEIRREAVARRSPH